MLRLTILRSHAGGQILPKAVSIRRQRRFLTIWLVFLYLPVDIFLLVELIDCVLDRTLRILWDVLDVANFVLQWLRVSLGVRSACILIDAEPRWPLHLVLCCDFVIIEDHEVSLTIYGFVVRLTDTIIRSQLYFATRHDRSLVKWHLL